MFGKMHNNHNQQMSQNPKSSPPKKGITPPKKGITPPKEGITPPKEGITPPKKGPSAEKPARIEGDSTSQAISIFYTYTQGVAAWSGSLTIPFLDGPDKEAFNIPSQSGLITIMNELSSGGVNSPTYQKAYLIPPKGLQNTKYTPLTVTLKPTNFKVHKDQTHSQQSLETLASVNVFNIAKIPTFFTQTIQANTTEYISRSRVKYDPLAVIYSSNNSPVISITVDMQGSENSTSTVQFTNPLGDTRFKITPAQHTAVYTDLLEQWQTMQLKISAEYLIYNLTIYFKIQVAGDIFGYDGTNYTVFDISQILNYGNNSTTVDNTVLRYTQQFQVGKATKINGKVIIYDFGNTTPVSTTYMGVTTISPPPPL